MIRVIKEKSTASPEDSWSTQRIIDEASKYDSVLDVGCGIGKHIKAVKADVRVGVDAFGPVLEAAKRGNNGVVFKACDLNEPNGLAGMSFDCVMGIDIVEHFVKDDAVRLIARCEQIAKKEVLFFIPVGAHPQTKDDRGFKNDYYQVHRSTWHPEDMERLGYDVWYYPNWYDWAENVPKEKGAMFCQKIM